MGLYNRRKEESDIYSPCKGAANITNFRRLNMAVRSRESISYLFMTEQIRDDWFSLRIFRVTVITVASSILGMFVVIRRFLR